MLVYRLLSSFAIGLTLGCLLLLAPARPMPVPNIEIELPPSIAFQPPAGAEAATARADGGSAPTIIDVAPGISAAQLALAIRIAPDEHVVGVDGVAVHSELGAGVRLASLDLRSPRFLDLQVRGPAGERRIVVLMH